MVITKFAKARAFWSRKSFYIYKHIKHRNAHIYNHTYINYNYCRLDSYLCVWVSLYFAAHGTATRAISVLPSWRGLQECEVINMTGTLICETQHARKGAYVGILNGVVSLGKKASGSRLPGSPEFIITQE